MEMDKINEGDRQNGRGAKDRLLSNIDIWPAARVTGAHGEPQE